MTTEGAARAVSTAAGATGTWRIAEGSTIEFAVRLLRLRTIRGRLRGLTGEIVVGASPGTSSVTATIDLATVDTGWPRRDDAIRSKKLLLVERNPTASYRSTAVRPLAEPGAFSVEGDLTFLGVTRPVPLDVRVQSPAAPSGSGPAFRATAQLIRTEFGFTLNEGPGFMNHAIGATVDFTLTIEGA